MRIRSRGAGNLFETLSCLLAAGCGLLLLALVVAAPLELGNQVLLGAAGIAFGLLLQRFRHPLAAVALVALSFAASGRYFVWRLTAALPSEPSLDLVAAALLLLAELYACAMLVLGAFQAIRPIDRKPQPLPERLADWPSVDVFVPTLDEPLSVVRATVLAAKSLDWPAGKLNVYLLDDGDRAAFRAFATQAAVGYFSRREPAHGKSGSLNHALARTRGELVAVFDCDHVPTRSFLQATVGLLVRGWNVAAVQTPQHAYSADPFERNLRAARRMPREGALFHGLIQRGSDFWNAALFTGSCAVLRRNALDAIGGFAAASIHTSLRFHRRGHAIAYLPVPLAAAPAARSLAAYVAERTRCARGLVQLLRKEKPLFGGGGLGLAQRLCYLAASLRQLCGLPRLLLFAVPIACLALGLHAFAADPAAVVAWWLPHLLLASLASSRLHAGLRHSFWSAIHDTCLAAHLVWALLRPAGGARPERIGGSNERLFFDRRTAAPWLTLGAATAAALAAGTWRFVRGGAGDPAFGLYASWSVYNLVVVACAAAVAWEARETRAKHRVSVELAGMLRLADGRTLRCTTGDLSLAGARLQLGGDRALTRGDRVHVSIFGGGEEEVPLPAEVVAHEAAGVRVRFVSLSVEEEGHLVRQLFSRADAWVGHDDAPTRQPFRTFALLLARGAVAVFRLVVPRPPQAGGAP